VEFNVQGSGTAQWFFGSGALPYSQFGIDAVTSYETLGNKTFTLVLNGVAYTYTDFLEIRQVALTVPPQINTSTVDLCEGDAGDFTSSMAGDNYYWQLSTENDTTEFVGPGFQVLNHIFDTVGIYQLTLQTETACCGISFTDTVMIVVDSIISPSIDVQSDLFGAGFGCEASSITFTAAAYDVGTFASYEWTVNGTNVGLNQPVFTTNTLSDGDQVNCNVTSSLGCAAGTIAQGMAITISLIDPPQVTCEVDSFQAGDPTHYVGSITAGGLPPFEYFWTFGDGIFGFGEDIYHIYDDGGIYTVELTVVDSNGCEAICQTQIDVASFLSVDFNINGLPIDSMSGCAPLTVPFENTSVNASSHFWDFGDGQFSNDENPSHIYASAGLYTVTLFAYSASGNDSASVENLINVLSTPTASFQPIEVNPEEGADTVQFADNSLGATSWFWDFGDPASGAENVSLLSNPIHVYQTNGSYIATLIVTNQFGCVDTISIPHGVNVGIEDNDQAFSVYPNPTNGSVYLNINKRIAEVELSVKDLVGKEVKTINVHQRSQGSTITIDLSHLGNGTYLLSFITAGSERIIPIIVTDR
jgi:PKD repeat protein